MSINIFNILIICGVVQGFIFSIITLRTEKYNNKPYKFLVHLVLAISFSNLFYWFKDIGLAAQWDFYELLYIPFDLLILPFYYFFVCSYIGVKNKYAKYLLIPFVIRFIFQIGIIIYTLFIKPNYSLSDVFIRTLYKTDEYGTILFMLFCVFYILKIIHNYERQHNQFITKNTKWLKQLLFLGIGLCVFWFAVTAFNDFIPDILNFRKKYYIIWIGLSLLIYWIGYIGIYYLGIFNQSQELRTKLASAKRVTTKVFNGNIDRFNEIDYKIKNERLYTNPSISLLSIAQLFNLSENYVSQLINNHTMTNFSTYINNLRVEKTKLILANKDYNHYTIIAIALEAGFNSKSTFYAAFKKHTGILPSEYRKHVQETKANNLS